MLFVHQLYSCFLLLAIGAPSSVMGDWSCYDISGVIAGTAHRCVCTDVYCNEDKCVNDGGIWAENCNSCSCDGLAEPVVDSGLQGDGCYDTSVNECSCDPSVCSEGSCSSSGGQWTDSCRSCQCAGTATPQGGGGACFSELMTAEVLSNIAEQEFTSVAMKDLRVGDRVKTTAGRYEAVYAFGHFHETKPTAFLKIQTTAPTAPLEVTGDHLIFVDGKKSPVRADSIRVGDVLHHRPGAHATIVLVTDISKVFREGIYAPLTPDGTIVVNEIVASSYAAISAKSTSENIEVAGWSFFGISQADAIHLTLSPLRIMCSANGSTSSICKELDDETRMNKYVAWGVGTIHWAETQNAVLQLVMMVLGLLVGAFTWILEKVYSLDYFIVTITSLLLATIYCHRSYSTSSKVSNTI